MQQHVLIYFVIHVGHPHGIDLISSHCRIIWLFFSIWQRKKSWATGRAGIWHLLGLAELSITQSESTPIRMKWQNTYLYQIRACQEVLGWDGLPH